MIHSVIVYISYLTAALSYDIENIFNKTVYFIACLYNKIIVLMPTNLQQYRVFRHKQ